VVLVKGWFLLLLLLLLASEVTTVQTGKLQFCNTLQAVVLVLIYQVTSYRLQSYTSKRGGERVLR
jgi:hypothetical protein